MRLIRCFVFFFLFFSLFRFGLLVSNSLLAWFDGMVDRIWKGSEGFSLGLALSMIEFGIKSCYGGRLEMARWNGGMQIWGDGIFPERRKMENGYGHIRQATGPTQRLVGSRWSWFDQYGRIVVSLRPLKIKG